MTNSKVSDGGSEIYREANSRYIAVKYSVRGRDLGSTVEEAIKKVGASVKLPTGYTIDWAGEYESQKRSERRLLIVLPVTIVLIFIILYTMFQSVKWALLILTNVAMARIGGLLALLITHTNFSVSSGVGFLALFGVSVQTGVIMVEYINQLRARGYTIGKPRWRVPFCVFGQSSHDHVSCHHWAAPSRLVAWHRIGFPTAVRDRHCRWADFRPRDQYFSTANSLCLVCTEGRSTSGA